MVRPDPAPLQVIALAVLAGVAWVLLPRRQAWVATVLCGGVLWLLFHPLTASHVLRTVDAHAGGIISYLRSKADLWVRPTAKVPFSR